MAVFSRRYLKKKKTPEMLYMDLSFRFHADMI